MAYEIKRFEYAGTVDADGHILEPPELWEEYLPARFKDRAMRIALDDEGYEYLEIYVPGLLLTISSTGHVV